MPFLLTTVALEVVPVGARTSLEESPSGSHRRPSSSSWILSLRLSPLRSISSGFVVFCRCKTGSGAVYIHCIWVASWGKKWSRSSSAGLIRGFELIKILSGIQMVPMPLSPQRRPPPLFKGFWLIVLVDGFIQGCRKSSSEHVDSLRTVDIVFGMSYEFFKVGNISIKILSLHPDPLTKRHTRFFFLEGVSELSVEREEATVP